MRGSDFLCLTYHELYVPGRPTQGSDGGYMRYVVKTTAFVEQIKYLREAGWHGCTVTEALRCERPVIALSFDDGTATDVDIAAPELCNAGFTATFFVVADWVGKRGYLTPADLRRLVDLGLEVGSHSLTHAYLTTLGPKDLRRELQESKQRLEQWIGSPVSHFSCPFGTCSPTVIKEAEDVGYATVATSEVGTNRCGATVLNRVAVRSETSLPDFSRICRGQIRKLRARQFLLTGLRSVIGLPAYAALCRLLPCRTTARLSSRTVNDRKSDN